MEKIDVFDWDKTLYKKDSTIEFYKFCIKKKKTIISYLPLQIVFFLLYKLKLVKKIIFKEVFFKFLKSVENLDEYVKEFWNENKKYIKYDLIEGAKNKKIVISASPEFLLEDICKEVGINKLIASKVDKRSGKFSSENCYGKEKVNRLKKEIQDFTIENFYTDSESDIYLANISTKKYLIIKGEIKEWKIESKN